MLRLYNGGATIQGLIRQEMRGSARDAQPHSRLSISILRIQRQRMLRDMIPPGIELSASRIHNATSGLKCEIVGVRKDGKKRIMKITPCFSGILCLLGAAPLCAGGAEYESPPVLKAESFAPRDVPLKGNRYSVDADVATDGLLATFTIRSDFGRIEARGPGVLKMRVAEVEALARLKEMAKTDVFKDSLKQSASAIGGAVANVVTNTEEVVKAVPASVGRFLERTGRAAKTAVQKLDDVRQDKEAGAPRGAEASTNGQNLALAAGTAAGRATRDVLGYDGKRRELARQLRVDPYTTNPLLKKELDDVAWAAFAGGLGVSALAMAVPGGKLIQSTSVVTEWVYEKPPGDLRVWIEKSLKGMGVDQETVDLFLRQKYWTLTTQTALTLALGKLDGVEGRAEVLDTAVTAEDEDQARFLALGMSLLAREHKDMPLKSIIGGKPIGVSKKGRAIATMPIDYAVWSERVADFAKRDDLQQARPILKVAGRLSPRARTEMEALGWEVHEQAPLAGVF
jgi:hypothetical protein